jgi:hypothetical protein
MPLLVRLVMTTVFAGAGWYCVQRCAGPIGRMTRPADRANDGFHTIMNAAMIAMVWTAPRIPGWQMAVFGVACAWFVVQATGVPLALASVRVDGGSEPRSIGCEHGGRMRCLHHATVMAAMVWMIAAMSPMTTGSSSMAGMAMPTTASSPYLARVAAGYCLATAMLLVAAGARARRRIVSAHGGHDHAGQGHGSLADDVCHAAMTGGMGTMILMTL